MSFSIRRRWHRAQSVRRTSLRDKTLTTKKDAVEETRLRLRAQEVGLCAVCHSFGRFWHICCRCASSIFVLVVTVNASVEFSFKRVPAKTRTRTLPTARQHASTTITSVSNVRCAYRYSTTMQVPTTNWMCWVARPLNRLRILHKCSRIYELVVAT